MDKQHFLHRLEDISNQQKNHHSNQTASDEGSTVNLAEKNRTEDEKSTFDNLLKDMQKPPYPLFNLVSVSIFTMTHKTYL